MFDISNLSGSELIAFASSLAIYIGKYVSADEAGILANFFSALGDNLGIISSVESDNSTNSTNNSSCN